MAPLRRAWACATLLLLLALPPCCFVHLAAAQSHMPAEVDAAQLLLQIKREWGDPPVLEGWKKNTSAAAGGHCSWPHVGCDTAGRVVMLTIASAGVRGPFPDAVGSLSALAYLDVSNNSISGAFPAALYRCASLDYLDLSFNNFSGELPSDIGRRLAPHLTTLFLYNNRFSGTIPVDLSALTRLVNLDQSENPFDVGELPASFKNLSNLSYLGMAQCNLVGDFPSHVLEMSELEVLDLSMNALTRSIPPRIWSLMKLQQLFLYMTNLTGEIVVDEFAAKCLTYIHIYDNYSLSGSIPEAFGHLENVTHLYLFNNNFSGEILASMGRLPSLYMLDLSINRFHGTLPPELGKHSHLVWVNVDNNELTGTQFLVPLRPWQPLERLHTNRPRQLHNSGMAGSR